MKMHRLALIVLMLLLPIVSSSADDTNLSYKVMYQTENGAYAWQGITVFAGLDGAGKGYDGEDVYTYIPSSGIVLGIHRTSGVNGWNGNSGWSSSDIREMLAPGQSITVDDIYMWAVPGTGNHDMHLRLSDKPFLNPCVSYSLSLVSIPQGIDCTGRPTTWGPETSEIVLPFYSTDYGENGYKFRLNVFAVPEPSGVLAFTSGLVCLGGMLIKRRMS